VSWYLRRTSLATFPRRLPRHTEKLHTVGSRSVAVLPGNYEAAKFRYSSDL
jgi:hypothetical protein